MPRGVRAIHGHEVQGGPHGHSGEADGTVIVVESAWLPVTCWCERRFVAVKQSDILDGYTASCDHPECRGPQGQRTPGYLLQGSTDDEGRKRHRSGIVGSGEANWSKVLKELPEFYPERPRARAVTEILYLEEMPHPTKRHALHNGRKKRATRTAREVAERRDLILQLWWPLGNARAIAKHLDLPLYTVNNDLQWLKARGRL